MNLGTRVLAKWPAEESWWYPGTVVSPDGNPLEVLYDDGARSELAVAEVEPFSLPVGSRVYCRWKSGDLFYPGIVTQTVGNAIHIDYDDGDKEWTTAAMVRIQR